MLRPGDRAPDFELETSNGDRLSRSDLAGQFAVMIFYPKNDTPG